MVCFQSINKHANSNFIIIHMIFIPTTRGRIRPANKNKDLMHTLNTPWVGYENNLNNSYLFHVPDGFVKKCGGRRPLIRCTVSFRFNKYILHRRAFCSSANSVSMSAPGASRHNPNILRCIAIVIIIANILLNRNLTVHQLS